MSWIRIQPRLSQKSIQRTCRRTSANSIIHTPYTFHGIPPAPPSSSTYRKLQLRSKHFYRRRLHPSLLQHPRTPSFAHVQALQFSCAYMHQSSRAFACTRPMGSPRDAKTVPLLLRANARNNYCSEGTRERGDNCVIYARARNYSRSVIEPLMARNSAHCAKTHASLFIHRRELHSGGTHSIFGRSFLMLWVKFKI